MYPHAALVGLFELPQRVLYKKGPDRATGFALLAGLLESVSELNLDSSDRWQELRTIIDAPGPGDLTRIEDEIDAILCAHVAWLWRKRADALAVFGSVEEGYIVAPPKPTHAANLNASAKPSNAAPRVTVTLEGLSEASYSALVRFAETRGVSVEHAALTVIESALGPR